MPHSGTCKTSSKELKGLSNIFCSYFYLLKGLRKQRPFPVPTSVKWGARWYSYAFWGSFLFQHSKNIAAWLSAKVPRHLGQSENREIIFWTWYSKTMLSTPHHPRRVSQDVALPVGSGHPEESGNVTSMTPQQRKWHSSKLPRASRANQPWHLGSESQMSLMHLWMN